VWPSLGSGDRERNVALVRFQFQLRREPLSIGLGALAGQASGSVGALWGLTAAWRGVFGRAHGPYKSLIQWRPEIVNSTSITPNKQGPLHVICWLAGAAAGLQRMEEPQLFNGLDMSPNWRIQAGFACSISGSRSFPSSLTVCHLQ
jgi:hypothetical protein